MLWNPKGIKVFLDVSTYCNAGCPQCHRTSTDGLGKMEWLPLIRWDLETFQKAFPPEELQDIKTFKFCGTWGDPVMCKELYQMCEYIISNSFWTTISIDTNGSIRSSDWWWELGVLCGKRLDVVFAVDGVDQAMHEKYRRFTNLDKVLSNMEMLSHTKAIAKSQTILFAHNAEYQDEIQELVSRYGSTNHSFVISDRFKKNNGSYEKYFFTGPDGKEEYFERAAQEVLPNGTISGTKDKENVYEIRCRWAQPRNEVVVNPDGQVLPCCFHANGHYQNQFDSRYGSELHRHSIYADEYDQNPEQYNVLHRPLSAILNTKFFTETLEKSMESDTPVPQCARQCSNRIQSHHQIRVYNELS